MRTTTFLVLTTVIFSFISNSFAFEQNGYAFHRLIFLRKPSAQFNPNQDILNPSAEEKNDEIIKNKLMGAVTTSLISLAKGINLNPGANVSEKSSSNSVLGAVNTIYTNLKKELSNIDVTYKTEHNALLLPFGNKEQDLFYKDNKVSMTGQDLLNVIGAPPESESFGKKVTEEIKKVQDFYFNNSAADDGKAYLLGMITKLKIENGKKYLFIDALLGIRPEQIPYNNSNDKVTFKQIEIPRVNENGRTTDLCAVVNISVNLNDSNDVLVGDIAFGNFEKFNNGLFVLSQKNANLNAPRLIGNINKPHLSNIAANFSIPKIDFDLKTRKVTGIFTYTSFGLEVMNKRFIFGGIHLGMVDNQFQDEINKTIDAETSKAINQGIEKADQFLMEKIMGALK